MNACCIKHVDYSIHDKDELNGVIDGIRIETASEGSVLYLLNAQDAVIGLCKVKASSYVIRRRIRERCRIKLFRPLQSGNIEGLKSSRSKGNVEAKWTLSEAQSLTKAHLKKGMNQLGHVPNHQKMKGVWSQFAVGFVDWWIRNKLGDETSVRHVDEVLLET